MVLILERLPASLELALSATLFAVLIGVPLGVWAADGLLAVFFYVAGLELKRDIEFGLLQQGAGASSPRAHSPR